MDIFVLDGDSLWWRKQSTEAPKKLSWKLWKCSYLYIEVVGDLHSTRMTNTKAFTILTVALNKNLIEIIFVVLHKKYCLSCLNRWMNLNWRSFIVKTIHYLRSIQFLPYKKRIFWLLRLLTCKVKLFKWLKICFYFRFQSLWNPS